MHDVQGSRIPVQDLTDIVASYCAPVVLMLDLVTFLVWILVGKFMEDRMVGKVGINALVKMVTIFVISCPCVISLCVPMVVIIDASVAAKKGVLFRVCCVKLLVTSDFIHPNLYPVITSRPSLSNMPGT